MVRESSVRFHHFNSNTLTVWIGETRYDVPEQYERELHGVYGHRGAVALENWLQDNEFVGYRNKIMDMSEISMLKTQEPNLLYAAKKFSALCNSHETLRVLLAKVARIAEGAAMCYCELDAKMLLELHDAIVGELGGIEEVKRVLDIADKSEGIEEVRRMAKEKGGD